MYKKIIKPGFIHGIYPNRIAQTDNILDQFVEKIKRHTTIKIKSEKRQIKDFLNSVHGRGEIISRLKLGDLERLVPTLHLQLKRKGLEQNLVADCFAFIQASARLTIGISHYDEQLMAGWALLNGRLVEMATGEGKTYTAALAAATMAITGTPVHMITTNDYLAERDASLLSPLYQMLGLTVGVIVDGAQTEERRKAYSCDITYCSNKEVAFDFMRDHLGLDDISSPMRVKLRDIFNDNSPDKKPVLRGLCYAIVDEADSVLIDDAKTPLIIANEKNNSTEEKIYSVALSIATKLKPQSDFILESIRGPIHLSEQGQLRIEKLTSALGGIWTGTTRRDYFIELALTALHVFIRDRHYLVSDNKIHLVDENTGRTMLDRSWEAGLQQMIETKEGCPITGQRETIARLSYQKFFSHYLSLAGMTGTAKECESEILTNYNLQTLTIPTHRPIKRKNLGTKMFKIDAEKWRYCIVRIHKLHKQGRPILIGTRTVETSEYLSKLLTKFRLQHRVLNAKQNEHEAEITAQAGQKGQITVATNMAGRGTDIKVTQEVIDKGGLHVIIVELNEEARIDRQLYGRCGRQGENGSYEFILSLDEPIILEMKQNSLLYNWLKNRHKANKPLPKKMSLRLINQVQSAIARRNRKIRKKQLNIEEQIKRLMAFSGK